MTQSRTFAVALTFLLLFAAASADATLLTFNSPDNPSNAAARQAWLNAIGIGAPAVLEDFETGFANGQNVHGLGGLFPLGLVISDSDAGQALITSNTINGSNPVGTFSLTQNEEPFLEFDFSANPISYFGFLDIDQAGTNGIVTFVGGATAAISYETTAATGNSAEFFGIFNNDMPLITKVQLDASGDGLWAVDNLEYGTVPEPATLVLLGLGLSGLAILRRRGGRLAP